MLRPRNHRNLFAFLLGLSLPLLSLGASDPLAQVNPWMGVSGRGNCSVGPQLPWGSINPGPDSDAGYSDGYSPAKKIRGFSQLHVTGTGSFGKYGQFLVSPQIGLHTAATGHDSVTTNELARVGEYSVRLTDYQIGCAFTPTAHAVLYRFEFPTSEAAHVLVDLGHTVPGSIFRAGLVEDGEVFVDAAQQRLQGWGLYWGGWSAEPVKIYFAAQFNQPAASAGTWKNDAVQPGGIHQKVTQKQDAIGAYMRFNTVSNTPVFLKLAVSFTSMARAAEFLAAEIPDWDYQRVLAAATQAWAAKLGQIRIEGGSDAAQQLFYTTLYQTMRMPKNRTGDNPAWSSAEPYWDDYYCLWDSWRTLMPLNVLLHESMVRDNLKAFVDRYRQNGLVQDAFIGGNDRYYKWLGEEHPEWLGNQGGDNVDNLITDAFVKNVAGVDWAAAYELVQHNADHERAPIYRAQQRGWVPYRKYAFGLYCSRSLEFAYNDDCAARLAAALGRTNDAARYQQRSRGWEQLWNPAATSDGYHGFIMPRSMNGEWVAFDPKKEQAATSPGVIDRVFYQGSSWVYSYFVPHDFARLIALSGGAPAYCDKLVHALENGLIDFGNEPSFLTPYSFIYAGRPDLCAFWVRKNMGNYTATNFPGDEDGGAMSAWYVFASLGLFPNAGQDIYLLNGPTFPLATLTMENGHQIIIEGVNASPENLYVQSLTVNGQPWPQAWIRHHDLARGATLRFVMGPKPSNWGDTNPPPSLSQR